MKRTSNRGGHGGGIDVRSWHFCDIEAAWSNVRFRALFGHQRVARLCRRMTDAVDKVGDEQRMGNNRIQVPRYLNQCCAPDSYLETMLLTRSSKNVYRQHRPKADVALSRESGVRAPGIVRCSHLAAIWRFDFIDGEARLFLIVHRSIACKIGASEAPSGVSR